MDICVDTFCYTWSVSEREFYHYNRTQSQSFRGTLAGISWSMLLFIDGEKQSGTEFGIANISLTMECSESGEIDARYYFLVNGQRLEDNKFHRTFNSGESVVFPFSLDKLSTQNGGPNKGISPVTTIAVNLSQEIIHAKLSDPPSSLSQSFGRMMENSKFSDIVIESGDGFQFPVHQSVLDARSPVFCAMLDTDMMESRTKTIVISEFSSSTVKDMITYMYTGRVPKLRCSSAAELLKVADKYELRELMAICSEVLILNLCPANAVQLLLLADTYSDAPLKSEALRFIAQNKFRFTEDRMFELVKNSPKLLMDIITTMATYH